ncbi:hypothetical protein ABPG73_021698 [Tetrahymena malaccensis]
MDTNVIDNTQLQEFQDEKIYIFDTSQTFGVDEYTIKNINFRYYLQDKQSNKNNRMMFAQETKIVNLENILIENELISDGDFIFDNLNQLYINNFRIRNSTFLRSKFIMVWQTKKIIIQNLFITNCTLEDSILITLKEALNINIVNITFKDNILKDLKSKFMQITNTTQTNIRLLYVENNINLLNIYNGKFNSQKSLENSILEFKKAYLIQLYSIQSMKIIQAQIYNNTDTQLIQISSSSQSKNYTTTLYQNQVYLNQFNVLSNQLYLENDKIKKSVTILSTQNDNNYSNLINNFLDPVFIKNFNVSEYVQAISGFSFIEMESSNIQIQNSTFNGNISPVTNGVAWIMYSQKVLITNSTFNLNYAGEGGAFYFSNQCQITIQGSVFIGNNALFSGGAVLVESQSTLKITNSKFISNLSQSGGAIRTRLQSKFTYDKQTQNQFQNNYGQIWGNNWSETSLLKLKIKKIICFEQNGISYYSDIDLNGQINEDDNASLDMCFKDYIISDNQSEGVIKGMRSGGSLTIVVQLIDQDGKQFDIPNSNQLNSISNSELNQMSISIQANSQNLIIQNDILISLLRYSQEEKGFVFENVRFKIKEFQKIENQILEQNQNLSFSILLKSFYGNYTQIIGDFKFKIDFRLCQKGEIYLKEKSNDGGVICELCQKGSYSFDDPMNNLENSQITNFQCKECPQSAYICFKDQVHLKNGYWRESQTSEIIILCNNEPSNCLAQSNKNQTSICKVGHIGPLCESCDNYGNIWENQYVSNFGFKCVECNQNNKLKLYAYVAIIFIGFTIYMYMQVRNHIDQVLQQQKGYYIRMIGFASIYTSCFRDGTRYKVKIVLYFLQIVNSINRIELYIPSIFNYFIISFGSPSTSLSLQTQCILLKKPNSYEITIPLLYSQRIIVFLSPFLYFIGISSIHYLLISMKIVSRKSNFLTTTFVLVCFFLQPNVIALIVSALSCRKIGNKFYVQADIQYECFDYYHSKFAYFFFIPAIIFWLIVPLAFFKRLSSATEQNRESFSMLYKYGYLYSEYKTKLYFWEFIKILLRMIVTISTNLFSEYFQEIQTFNILLIFSYIVALLSIKPYKFRHLVNLDLLTHILLIFMILLNIQHNYFLEESEQNTALSIIWMSFFLSYILTVGYIILSESFRIVVLPQMVFFVYKLSKVFNFLKPFYIILERNLGKSKIHVFKKWKLIKINLKYLVYLKISRQNKQAIEQLTQNQSEKNINIDFNQTNQNNTNNSRFKLSSLNTKQKALNIKNSFNIYSDSQNKINQNNSYNQHKSIFFSNSLIHFSPTKLTREGLNSDSKISIAQSIQQSSSVSQSLNQSQYQESLQKISYEKKDETRSQNESSPQSLQFNINQINQYPLQREFNVFTINNLNQIVEDKQK